MSVDWRKVQRVAEHTRGHIVDFARDVAAKKFGSAMVEKFPWASWDLSCWCAIASVVLKETLAEKDIDSTVVVGNFKYRQIHDPTEINHTWLQINRRIVDITATQFDRRIPDVMITACNDSRYTPIHFGTDALKSFKSWPSDQMPLTFRRVNKINMILDYMKAD